MGSYIYEYRYYVDRQLFTGIKDDIEYIDGVVKPDIYAEYSGEYFDCYDIPNVSDYETKYTVIKFTPSYSQEYLINLGGGVMTIGTKLNDIRAGRFDYSEEYTLLYLDGGTTYYIGIARPKIPAGTIYLNVYPNNTSGGSSSNGGSSSY